MDEELHVRSTLPTGSWAKLRDLTTHTTAPVDEDFAVPNTFRYIAIFSSNAPSFELPEWWLSENVTTTTVPDPYIAVPAAHNAERADLASGASAVTEYGPPVRRWRLSYRDTTTADTTALDALIAAVGMVRAFIFDPPYDDEDAVVVRFEQEPRRYASNPVPAGGSRMMNYEFALVEVLD